MDTLANFYNNLFTIEITVLGIIAAAVFVVLQLLHSSFSYKDMLLSVKRVALWIYVLLSVVIILVTGLGSLHFAIEPHDVLPSVDFRTSWFVKNDYTPTLLLLGFLVSAVLGIFTVVDSIRLLDPISLMRKHLANMDTKAVTRFLYKRYGVPTPFPPVRVVPVLPDGTEKPLVTKEHLKEAEEKYVADQKRAERLRIESEDALEVFEGFDSLLVKALAAGDRSTVKHAVPDWVSRIKSILNDAGSSFPTRHLATYVGESLGTYLEACKKHDIQSVELLPKIRTTH